MSLPKVLIVDDWINLLAWRGILEKIVEIEIARYPNEALAKLKTGGYFAVAINANNLSIAAFAVEARKIFKGSIIALSDVEDGFSERALRAGCSRCLRYRELYGELLSLTTN